MNKKRISGKFLLLVWLFGFIERQLHVSKIAAFENKCIVVLTFVVGRMALKEIACILHVVLQSSGPFVAMHIYIKTI